MPFPASLPRDQFQHIDQVLSGTGSSWDTYAIGIRRIHFLCKTRGFNPSIPSGVIEFFVSVLGKENEILMPPDRPYVCYTWYDKGGQWILYAGIRGVEFHVLQSTTTEAALETWKVFHNRFDDGRSPT